MNKKERYKRVLVTNGELANKRNEEETALQLTIHSLTLYWICPLGIEKRLGKKTTDPRNPFNGTDPMNEKTS